MPKCTLVPMLVRLGALHTRLENIWNNNHIQYIPENSNTEDRDSQSVAAEFGIPVEQSSEELVVILLACNDTVLR